MNREFDKDYWEEHWRADSEGPGSMSGRPPNPYLAHETGALEPGTALDAGCGAGAEAIWLAEHGWQVTAADISREALARAAQRARTTQAYDRIRWVEADLTTWEPSDRYSLVMTHYAHPTMAQLDFYERVAGWVTPGGTLLIVGHLHRHGGTSDQPDHHEGDRSPEEASATAAAITGLLDSRDWEVVTAEEHERVLGGHEGGGRLLHDVVVRATRRR